MTEGLLFRLEATLSREDDLARFLEDSLPGTLDELPLTACLAVRFDMTSFGVIATFSAEEGQAAHVGDRVAAVLREREELYARTPTVAGFDVLASRVNAAAVST